MKTDGVPLYVEEMTKMLAHSDLLQEEAEQYVLTGQLTTVTIPDTLQDSLMAQLDQLGAATSLAQLWQSQDKRREAHNLLAPVYEWFTEGFDTADLKDAKDLLEI